MTEFLDLLTPYNCFVVHRCKDYAETLGANLRTETIYNTKFGLEKIDDATLEFWGISMPRKDEKLGYPPQNIFVPTGALKPVKGQLIGGQPGKPT